MDQIPCSANPYSAGCARNNADVDTDSASIPIMSRCCSLKSKSPAENNFAFDNI